MKRTKAAVPDRLFFPLMLLFILGMVWAATWRDKEACPTGSVSAANTDYRTIKVSGMQLNRFISGETIDKAPCKASIPYRLGLRARTADFPADADIGPHFRIAPDIEVAFSGKPIRIVVRARTAKTNGAEGFELNYLTGPEGQSGWQYFALTDTFADYTLSYNVPEAGQEQGVDFLGLHPVAEAQFSEMEIESITFLRR
jgi:hypothetical protein